MSNIGINTAENRFAGFSELLGDLDGAAKASLTIVQADPQAILVAAIEAALQELPFGAPDEQVSQIRNASSMSDLQRQLQDVKTCAANTLRNNTGLKDLAYEETLAQMDAEREALDKRFVNRLEELEELYGENAPEWIEKERRERADLARREAALEEQRHTMTAEEYYDAQINIQERRVDLAEQHRDNVNDDSKVSDETKREASNDVEREYAIQEELYYQKLKRDHPTLPEAELREKAQNDTNLLRANNINEAETQIASLETERQAEAEAENPAIAILSVSLEEATPVLEIADTNEVSVPTTIAPASPSIDTGLSFA